MNCQRYQVLKFVGLAVGFCAKFVTGSIFVFNVYQDAIKETFNYTQKEVEILSSMLNVGLGVGFVPGMFYDRFGPTFTSGAGLLISVPIYLLLWSTPKYAAFYSTKAWLMSIFFLLAGFGSVFTYMVALNTNIINFHSMHSGKIVGFLNAFFAGSPSVFATLYYNVFTKGDTSVVANQDFAGFMLFLAIMYGVANMLCMVFLRVYEHPDDKTVAVEAKYYKSVDSVLESVTSSANEKAVADDLTKSADNENERHKTDNDEASPLTLLKTLCNIDFQTFSWMFALSSSVGLVYTNNITVTSRSLGLEQYNDKLVIIVPISNAIVSASIGLISDHFRERIPRLSIVNVACVSLIISQAIVLIFSPTYLMLIIATTFAGAAIGIIWSICPTVMKEMFSVEHLGRNWGIALLWAALVAFASQALFGALYDAELPEDATEGSFCIGKKCISNGYIVFLSVAGLSFLMGAFILCRRRCCN